MRAGYVCSAAGQSRTNTWRGRGRPLVASGHMEVVDGSDVFRETPASQSRPLFLARCVGKERTGIPRAWLISTSFVDDPPSCMHHSGTQSKLHARWGSERSTLDTPTTCFVRCF